MAQHAENRSAQGTVTTHLQVLSQAQHELAQPQGAIGVLHEARDALQTKGKVLGIHQALSLVVARVVGPGQVVLMLDQPQRGVLHPSTIRPASGTEDFAHGPAEATAQVQMQ